MSKPQRFVRLARGSYKNTERAARERTAVMRNAYKRAA
jgi:hypothetical protein